MFVRILLLITVTVISLNSTFGQLDSILETRINQYREFHGLKTTEPDRGLDKAAQHHAQYVAKLDYLTHAEDKNVKGIVEISTPKQRAVHYKANVSAKKHIVGEVVCFANQTICIDDSTSSFVTFVDSIYNEDLNQLSIQEIVVLYSIFCWDGSPGHKQTLLYNRALFSGAYIELKKHDKYKKSLVCDNNGTAVRVDYYAVALLVKPNKYN